MHEAAHVSILRKLHDDIDRATAAAYGWPADLGTEDILYRLVELNQARQAEERRGQVRWLRPSFQAARFAAIDRPEQMAADMALPLAAGSLPAWPTGLAEQVRLVHDTLHRHAGPISAESLAAGFTGGRKRRERVAELLEVMAIHGQLRGDQGRYFLAR